MKLKMALTALVVAVAPGCATITRGTTEVLVIETVPPGADVRIDPLGTNCKSPCSVELKRKKDYTLSIDKAGFEPAKVTVLSEISGAGAAGMAGNVLVGGLIGVAVDAATGATKKLTPNPVKLTLVPLVPAATPAATPAPAQEGEPVRTAL